jgi:hypothetical protein
MNNKRKRKKNLEKFCPFRYSNIIGGSGAESWPE